VFSLGGSATVATSGYRDVAAMNGDGVIRKEISAFTGLNLRHFGSVGAVYAEIDRDPTPAQTAPDFAEAQHHRVVSANYSYQYHRATLYASAFKDTSSGGGSGFQVGVTIPIGRRSSVSVTGTSDGNVQMQAQKSAASVGDWGYNTYLSSGSSNHEFAEVQYKSSVGLFSGGVDESSGTTSARLEAQGAISLADGGVFPSNTIYDSFAVVDTGLPHVHVLQENRPVGQTNSSGKLLVPDMRAFDENHMGIEPTDVPADATFKFDSRVVRPQDRSGVIVRFPVAFNHAALVRLVDEADVPIPIGSTATLRATHATVPLGYDGDAYVEGLSQHNELTVERSDGKRCTAAFNYKSVPGEIPSIGPLRCQEVK
jgi:outer membrane usher protein